MPLDKKQRALLRYQLEGQLCDNSLVVPFGIVQRPWHDPEPSQPALDPSRRIPESIRLTDSTHRTHVVKQLESWTRVVFYYLSAIPPESVAHDTCFLDDGMPLPTSPMPRPIRSTLASALLAMDQYDLKGGRPIETWPYMPFVYPPSSFPYTSSEFFNQLSVIMPSPYKVWHRLKPLRLLGTIPLVFLDDLCPPDEELIVGLTYYSVDHTVSPPKCTSRRLSPDGAALIKHDEEYVPEPGSWNLMVIGDNLHDAILRDFDLQYELGWPDSRRNSSHVDMHPANWNVRQLHDDMPPYSKEKQLERSEYPKARTGQSVEITDEMLKVHRWLYWSYQCGRWTWDEILQAAVAKFGQLTRPKKASRGTTGSATASPISRRSATRMASRYARWLDMELRDGRTERTRKRK